MTKETALHEVAEQTAGLALWAGSGADETRAAELARHLGAKMTLSRPQGTGLLLHQDAEGLALGTADMEPAHMLRADFVRMLPRLKTENIRRELVVRAAKIRRGADQPGKPLAIDATAGLGEDALLLAAAGFQVRLYESNPVIAALLADALDRAARRPELADIASRMQLFVEDSVNALPHLAATERPDIVLLDPMFPASQKSALVKKKLQLLRLIEGPCTDEATLLQAALSAQPRKVVIKRPLKGGWLAGVKPAHSLAGKAIRFDCILGARAMSQRR